MSTGPNGPLKSNAGLDRPDSSWLKHEGMKENRAHQVPQNKFQSFRINAVRDAKNLSKLHHARAQCHA